VEKLDEVLKKTGDTPINPVQFDTTQHDNNFKEIKYGYLGILYFAELFILGLPLKT
jgi:hypothetical protein